VTVREHIPAGWTVTGEMPVLTGDPPLRIESPDQAFELEVEWTGDAFVGGARIDGVEVSILASSPTAIREWVLGALALVQPKS
jgi:hypothetical protein